jgi:hypothetical protein
VAQGNSPMPSILQCPNHLCRIISRMAHRQFRPYNVAVATGMFIEAGLTMADPTNVKGPTEPTIYCLQCRYPLDGLPERRCPECGSEFDPDDDNTFSEEPGLPRPWEGDICLICTFAFYFSCLVSAIDGPGPELLLLILSLPFGAVMGVSAIRKKGYYKRTVAWVAMALLLPGICFVGWGLVSIFTDHPDWILRYWRFH